MTPSEQAKNAVLTLKEYGFVRINGLRTLNVFAEKNDEDGRVPSPNQVQRNWEGSWGYDDGPTYVCLENGDILISIRKKPPEGELLSLLRQFCPNNSSLQLPYLKEERPYFDDILARFADPYCKPLA